MLAEDSVYHGLKRKINTKANFDPVLYVDVSRVGGDPISFISTYFFSVIY